jgi:hypothetical protein
MKMEPVNSSAIKAVAHDPATDQLRVQFPSGKTHVYYGVPAEEHAKLMGADSIGSHFSRNIRGVYKSLPLNTVDPTV